MCGVSGSRRWAVAKKRLASTKMPRDPSTCPLSMWVRTWGDGLLKLGEWVSPELHNCDCWAILAVARSSPDRLYNNKQRPPEPPTQKRLVRKGRCLGIAYVGFFRLMAYQPSRVIQYQDIFLEEEQWCYLTHCLEFKGVHSLFWGYLSEIKCNSLTGAQTRLLWFRSPAF